VGNGKYCRSLTNGAKIKADLAEATGEKQIADVRMLQQLTL